jgi:hypothetical protein
MALRRLDRAQRVGIFVGACLAVFVLLAHNPFNGYVTAVPWTNPTTPECLDAPKGDISTMTQAQVDKSVEEAKPCLKEGAPDLPFSLWRSSDPTIFWFGGVTHFVIAECAVVVLTALWLVLGKRSIAT